MSVAMVPGRPRVGRAAWVLRLASLALAGALGAGAARASPAARTWVPGELLVGFRAGLPTERTRALYRAEGAAGIDEIPQIRVVRLRVPLALLARAERALSRLPAVKFVERNEVLGPGRIPDDPQYPGQWHLPRILAPRAWDLTPGAPGVVIAILDTGIDPTHPDLAGQLVAGYNSRDPSAGTADAHGHGTQVAGVAAAAGDNAEGVASVAWRSSLMPVRVTDSLGRATSASIAGGISWAADHGASIINLSFAGVAASATIRAAAEYATGRGVLVVAAAGNCGCADPTAETPFLLSVSATDASDAVASFSSTGPFVDLSAPGTDILTTALGGLYLPDSGTSLASPVVAGVAALMRAVNPGLSPAELTGLLEATAIDAGPPGYDPAFGFGRVDGGAAVAAAAAHLPPVDSTPPVATLIAPSSGATLSGIAVIDISALDDVGVVDVALYVDGTRLASDSSTPYSFAWDTTGVADGAHVLQAIASDAAGHSGSSAPVEVTVSNPAPDTSPPTVAILSPAAGARVSGTLAVAVAASDDVGVARVDLLADGLPVGSAAAAPYAFAWNAEGAVSGPHALQAVAWDAAGHFASATLSVTVDLAPVARNDAYLAPVRSSSTYAPRVLAVLANDSDPDGSLAPGTVRVVTTPSRGGTARVNPDGTVTYAPRRGYRGTETFAYTVSDDLGVPSNVATVAVTLR